jgi:hypothetical protein
MNFLSFLTRLGIVCAMAVLPAGCGHKETDTQHREEHNHDHAEEGHDEENHSEEGHGEEDHGEESHDEPSSGASFKPGKGITLTDETTKILGVETAEASSEKLAQSVRLNVQVFGEKHRFPYADVDHSGCDVHGSGFLPDEKAALIEPNQHLELLTDDKEVLEGIVVAVQKTPALGEAEVVVGVTSAADKLEDGEFLTAVISVPREEAVVVIPVSALLRTSEGTFAYVADKNAYRRTPVKTGSESDDKIEITEGLSSGDRVVVKPVETLWLIELRATKGGGHSH